MVTHTFALLEVSKEAFEEIKIKLRAAGYDHAFVDGNIDMHGLALQCEPEGDPDLPASYHGKDAGTKAGWPS